MSDFIRPWDVNQSVEEINNTQSERSFFDNLRDAISAASANFDEVRGSEQLGDLRNELMDSQNLSDDEYNQKRAEYVQKEYERQQARNRFMQAQQNLENDDSFLKNLTQMGGTVEGMAAQLIGTAGGAALGALASPFTAGGSIAMGAKIGNAAGAVAGGYLDARSVALQAEEEVLEKGGTWEQAKLAYEEALKKASLTTLPETAVDIIMGNRLMRSALGSKAARNIAGSALGRVGSSVLDPAAKVGTAVSRATRPIIGRAAGLATDVALQGITEAGQEVTQDYIANREVAKALGQQDNEYSLGGFKDYALSDQGLETMKTAGIMGAVFGGAGGALSSGQYLQKGSKYTSSNKIHAVTEKMINEGKLSLNEEQRQNEEKIISAFTGISPAQLSTWSDADIIAQSAEIRGEYLRNTSHIDETQDITGVRGFVDVINGVGDNQQQKAKTEGELTALSNSALEEYGITPEDRQKFFSTPTENTLLEKAKKELQKQTEQEKQNGEKPQTKIGLTPETAATMNIKGGTIDVQENSTGEGQTTNLNMSQSARQSTDGVTAEVKYKDNIGEKWQGFTEYTKDGQELEGKAYKNTENGKVARITQGNDGAFYVLDTSEGNTQATRFETLEQAESHLIKNQDNKKVFQSANQQETKEKTTLEKGEVDADNGVTGQHVSNINDLFDFIQNNPDAISPEAFMEFVDMSRRIGTEGVDFYFDTKNYGYAKDQNGVYHQVRGWKQRRDESTGRALIQLYRGSDINTAVHEIAHVGYENLSQEDKKTFDTYAVKTMGRFIADLLNVNYDQNFRNRLLNLANDEELQKKINKQPAAFQAEIQLFLNGEVDINNLTEDQQRAIDERWAWEFTFWYMEGYVRGVEPKNIIQRLLNRSCIFLDKELKGIRRVWWHIHHKNSGAESLYRGTKEEPMNGDQQIAQQIQESEQTQQTENVAQQPIEQQQYDYGINPEEEQTQVTDSTGYTTEEPFTAQEQNYNNQEEHQNTQEEQQNNNKQNEQEEEPQFNINMNDKTAEIFADEGLKRFGNDIEQLKSALRKRYKATKSREEKKWITKIVKIAELKHFNKWKKQDSNPRLDNVVDVEQNQVGTENIQSTGLQQSNNGYFNTNPPQLNPAVMQETTITPQVEEKFDTNDTIEEENEVEENVVGDAIEEVAENIERIYKTELEPQEIRSIEGDINEVLDGLENETDKTVKKISQSVGKRIEAAKSALRKSNKEMDKGQEVYKLCSMSALKDVLDSRLKDGYYSKGNLNQDSVNNVGNLIKTQLGEIQEEWTKPYSEETESAARRDKAEADRIEKERKEAEKLAKKKQKKQAEVASQNLDILEQQIKNQQGEELTDDQLEEKADAELVKDNVPIKNTNGTKKKKKQTQTKAQEADRRQLIRAAAEKRGMLLDKNGQKPNRKNQQVNEVVEGWIDRLSKEENYDEAMSQLQELLNSNAITEEEYNDISKGLENYFEGEEDTESLEKRKGQKRFQMAQQNEFFVNGENITDKLNDIFFDTDFGYHLFGDNLSEEQAISELKQQLLQMNKDKREYMRFFETSSKEDIDDFGDRWKRKIDGLTESIKDLKEVLDRINKGDFVVSGNQQKRNGSNVIDITNRLKNNNKRFMAGGKFAKNSPIQNQEKLEEYFKQEMKKLGITDKLLKKYGNITDKLLDTSGNTKESKELFEYIKALNKINKKLWKSGNIYRGLDGNWRFWISDNKAKLQFGIQDLFRNFRKQIQNGNFYKPEMNLEDIIFHKELFKYYPQLRKTKILFYSSPGDRTGGYHNPLTDEIGINVSAPMFDDFVDGKDNDFLTMVLLHEVQHAIQEIEGFALGDNERPSFYLSEDKNDVLKFLYGKRDLLYDKASESLMDKREFEPIISYNNEPVLFSNGSSADYVEYLPPIFTGAIAKIGGIELSEQESFVLERIEDGIKEGKTVEEILKEAREEVDGLLKQDEKQLNEFNFNEDDEYNEEFDFEDAIGLSNDINTLNVTLQFIDDVSQKVKDGSLQFRKLKDSEVNKFRNKEFNKLNFLRSKKKLEEVLDIARKQDSNGDVVHNNEQLNILQKAIEDSGLVHEFYEISYGESEARDTMDSYKKYKRDVPMQKESKYKELDSVERVPWGEERGGFMKVRRYDKRYMFYARGAKNQTVLTEQKEKQFENDFRKTANLAGFTNKFIDDFFSNYKKNDAQLISNEKLNEKNLFNKSFIDFIDNYNKTMVKEHGVKRDLDGRWIGEFSDENSHVRPFYVGENYLKNITSKLEKTAKLSNIFVHNELFKYYPHLKDAKVIFTNTDGMRKRGSNETTVAAYFKNDNGEDCILINSEKLLNWDKDSKIREDKLRTDILHEVQHAIQDYEGLAGGGGISVLEETKLQKELLDDYAEGLGTTIDNIGDRFVEAFGNKSPYVKKHALDIIGGYINGLQNKQGVVDAEQKRIQNYCKKLSGLKTKDKELYNKYVKPLDQARNLYWTTLGEIRARQTEQRANMTMEERNKRTGLLDENVSKWEKFKDAPITVHKAKGVSNKNENARTTSRYNNGRNSSVESDTLGIRTQGIQRSEERPNKIKQTNEKRNNGNGRTNATRRYQKSNEKTPLEKAKEQRDARLEQQRKEGITSDFYKDVYSVSFTESAQQNEENKRKMEYFDKRSEYWDRNEKDGKVTYTRKTPFEHHQKVVTYNGINDVTKEQKKKSKPAQWAEWFKDQLIKYAFNDMHFLAKAARKLGVFDAYTKLVVTKGYALKANTAMERGIKYNGEYTRALNDIIKEVGEEKQHDFIEYCIAKRILDMKELRPEIRQKMSPEEAAELIEKYENGENAELFKKNQKDFVKYNHALLHVLVDGGIMTEEEFQHHIKNDPNFVPLAKVMDDADFGFNGIQAARSIVNVKSPIKKIGTSMREVKNPFLEMQKRTAEYYSIAARNKAGQIFVNEIAGKIDKLANGDTVARGQGMIRKIKIDEKDGKLITKPDEKQQIIYVCNNGKHEFYQVSDPEIYRALRALDADQMGTLHKMIDPFLHAPSALIRETATMVPDFGIRNLIRDGGEAFMTSEHGFLPLIDQIWGMYQMANNTEWYQRFLEQQGEYGSLNRDDANSGVARVEDTIDEKVNPIKNFNEIRRAAFEKFTNKKNSKTVRAAALLQLMGSMPYAIIKSNKRINDYLEMGTRVGEFKNAKMGYNGTLDRLSKGGILDWGADINNAKQSDILAAGVAKEITLNFGQHGIIGKQLNRYIPFFNATLQGIYKMCNALELMFTGRTLSGEKNHALQGEMLFKAALVTAMAIGVAAAGEGDDDYEEANQYEKENFWILPNGLRFPKDQVLGKLFGNVAEKSYAQWRKGKFEPSDILRSIVENFTPDKFMPAMADITLGGLFNYDTFYKSAIVPEYMQGKLGHLQKDLSTSNMASDISDFLWKYTKTDVSAKRLDWALQKNLTNCKKYIDSLYDLGKQAYDPKSFNEKMARGYDKSDSTGAFVGGLKDNVPKPLSLISGTFATNRTNYKSISDFYEKYNDLKKLATDEPSMSKEEKRQWKRYEQAYKKDKVFRKELRAIKGDSSLTGKQKREKADKIFKQQIKLAKWAEG